ncbi:MAG TPA: M48 family metallopeptidase [Noviherbaspirillum sp.]|uniref:M48 family metallopeptidase n=1 Tax=Noviherbaspirillum sp. TaxID=1926288 RepID=UPI002B4594B3|nr:M48 family metallopeptidase [Noviherbaspirillum sp.]HJV85448.1 M48 family metallopeptidase [Noviherbaspirillum sp.]
MRFALQGLTGATTRKRLLLLPAAVLLAACATTVSPPGGTEPAAEPSAPAPQKPVVSVSPAEMQGLQSLVSLQDRLYRVAAPLLVNNPELCKSNARNLLGFTAKTKYSYSADYVNAAQKVLGLDDRLQVMGVLPGSGAARAGVQRGDVLLAVEDKPMPQGENAERDAAAILAPLVMDRSSVKLSILRNGSTMTLNVPLTYACAYGVELGNADTVAAYSDGYRVLITRGMMSTVRSDDELAYVIAKEMAHNALAHAVRQKMSATVGGIIDNLQRAHPDMRTMVGLAGVKPMPASLDGMADKLSLYMLARAGYELSQVVPFWKRMASQFPPSVMNAYTAMHPATNYRIATMEKALKEIHAKLASKRPLMP